MVEEKRVLLADLGCGSAAVIGSISAALRCDAIGVEISPTRSFLAMHLLKKVIQTEIVSIGYLPLDIMSIDTLEFIPSLGYDGMLFFLGDEAFEDDLMEKVSSLLASLKTIDVLLVAGKQARHKCLKWKNYWDCHGFKKIKELDWKKKIRRKKDVIGFTFDQRKTKLQQKVQLLSQ